MSELEYVNKARLTKQEPLVVPGDEGNGGAPATYDIYSKDGVPLLHLQFQQGNPNDVGWNGLLDITLLEVVRHRLTSFQEGPFRCRETALAITKVEEAMQWVMARTIERQSRGVFQTDKP